MKAGQAHCCATRQVVQLIENLGNNTCTAYKNYYTLAMSSHLDEEKCASPADLNLFVEDLIEQMVRLLAIDVSCHSM